MISILETRKYEHFKQFLFLVDGKINSLEILFETSPKNVENLP